MDQKCKGEDEGNNRVVGGKGDASAGTKSKDEDDTTPRVWQVQRMENKFRAGINCEDYSEIVVLAVSCTYKSTSTRTHYVQFREENLCINDRETDHNVQALFPKYSTTSWNSFRLAGRCCATQQRSARPQVKPRNGNQITPHQFKNGVQTM